MNFGDTVSIPGCSLKSRHLETFSGCTALDALLGGSVPNTSFVVIDETGSKTYADVLLRLFAAEGIYAGHDVLYASSPLEADSLLDRLPAKCENARRNEESMGHSRGMGGSGDDMQIAWRYAPMKTVESSVTKQPSKFDLATPMPKEVFDQSSTTILPFPSTVDEPFTYQALLNRLQEVLKQTEYAKSKGPRAPGSEKPRLLRVVLRGLGSPLWEDDQELAAFLTRLPYLIRHSYVVIMATTDTSTMTAELSRQVETTADACLRLEAMNEAEKKMHDGAHGYLRIVRLPRLTSLAPPVPPSVDLTFELHRRSFDVKILHLPPALEDEEKEQSKMGCAVAAQF